MLRRWRSADRWGELEYHGQDREPERNSRLEAAAEKMVQSHSLSYLFTIVLQRTRRSFDRLEPFYEKLRSTPVGLLVESFDDPEEFTTFDYRMELAEDHAGNTSLLALKLSEYLAGLHAAAPDSYKASLLTFAEKSAPWLLGGSSSFTRFIRSNSLLGLPIVDDEEKPEACRVRLDAWIRAGVDLVQSASVIETVLKPQIKQVVDASQRPLRPAQPSRLILNDAGDVALLDGTAYNITVDAGRCLALLLKAKGRLWVSGKQMKLVPDSSERPDRIINAMPQQIRELISRETGKGYRLAIFAEVE